MRFLLLAVTLLLFLPPVDADWTSYQGDAHNSGHGDDGLALFGDAWWQNRLDGAAGSTPDALDESPSQITASVVVKDDIVVIGDWKGRLRALDAETGTEKWRVKFTGKISATAAIDGNKVFAVDEAGNMKSLDLRTGTELATATVGATLGSPTVDAGKVYIGNEAGEMKAYDTNSLTLDWSFKVTEAFSTSTTNPDTGAVTCSEPHPTGQIRGAPAIYDGKVFFGALNDHFYAVSSNGDSAGKSQLKWFFKAGDDIVSSPTISTVEKEVMFTSYDGKVYSIRATQSGEGIDCGKEITSTAWTYEVDKTNSPRLGSSPATDGTFVYFGSPDNKVYALNGGTGKLVWSYETGDDVNGGPSVAGPYVVVGSADGKVYWLAAADGAMLTSFSAGTPVESNPAIDDDHVFITSFDGTTFRLGPEIPTYADLIVSTATATENGISITVRNTGEKAAEATTVELYIDNELAATIDVPTIAAGDSATIEHAITLSRGDHLVKAIVDPKAMLKEDNEGNNQLEMTITIAAPDEGKKDDEGLPGPGFALLAAALAAIAIVRRRKA